MLLAAQEGRSADVKSLLDDADIPELCEYIGDVGKSSWDYSPLFNLKGLVQGIIDGKVAGEERGIEHLIALNNWRRVIEKIEHVIPVIKARDEERVKKSGELLLAVKGKRTADIESLLMGANLPDLCKYISDVEKGPWNHENLVSVNSLMQKIFNLKIEEFYQYGAEEEVEYRIALHSWQVSIDGDITETNRISSIKNAIESVVEAVSIEDVERAQGVLEGVIEKNQHLPSTAPENGEGSVVYPDGSVYTGGFLNGKRHGKGTLISCNGDRYIGDFKENERHGKGSLIYSSGDRYIGDFEGGKRHGGGSIIYPNGDMYIGNWEEDQRHGKGSVTYSTGGGYDGDWERGEGHGKGRLWNAGKGYYVGEFKNGSLVCHNSLKRKGYKILTVGNPGGSKAFTSKRNKEGSYEEGVEIKEVTNADINIAELCCHSKDGSQKQLIFHIYDHGDMYGNIAEEDLILGSLERLSESVRKYNKEEGDTPISRVKFNIFACYGDKLVTAGSLRFKRLIKGFVEMGVDVHTSAIKGESSTIISNGPYPASGDSPTTEVFERFFTKKDPDLIKKQLSKFKAVPDGTEEDIEGVTCLKRTHTFQNKNFLSGLSDEKLALQGSCAKPTASPLLGGRAVDPAGHTP